jgi:hypothetical protein
MESLSAEHVARVDDGLARGLRMGEALPEMVGGTQTADGLWRFFSASWPNGGVGEWNHDAGWNADWRGFLKPDLFSFGEDVFGNQLVLLTEGGTVFLWNHENAECHDLLVGPVELLRTVVDHGIDWIDFYADGSLSIARQCGYTPLEMHRHWTTPLILGGAASFSNVSLVERAAHLRGHAKLWSQLAHLPAGTKIVAK